MKEVETCRKTANYNVKSEREITRAAGKVTERFMREAANLVNEKLKGTEVSWSR